MVLLLRFVFRHTAPASPARLGLTARKAPSRRVRRRVARRALAAVRASAGRHVRSALRRRAQVADCEELGTRPPGLAGAPNAQLESTSPNQAWHWWPFLAMHMRRRAEIGGLDRRRLRTAAGPYSTSLARRKADRGCRPARRPCAGVRPGYPGTNSSRRSFQYP